MQETSIRPRSILQFRQDIEVQLRRHIREAVEVSLTEELAAALASQPYERREGRCGYRHGTTERTITTPDGTQPLRVPRGRLIGPDGSSQEFHSRLVPRYSRRTVEIDEAILGCYLGGINSRRIRTALKPLLGERHLSKSAVSRIVARLKALFTTWQGRELSAERYPIVFLDGFHLKVRVARRVVSVPVLAALGVAESGQKSLLGLRIAASEAEATWGAVVTDLQQRGLVAPLLLVVDGHGGLKKALEKWDGVRVQRCTTHKLENLKSHCPKHARAEMKRDYDRLIYAADALAARAAYEAFTKKWTTLCPAVAKSLEEAGLELLTFYDFPKAIWKSIRTTNTLENLNREFRRRTKTQASFGSEDAALTILYGLIAFGQIRLRKIDGAKDLPAFITKAWQKVA